MTLKFLLLIVYTHLSTINYSQTPYFSWAWSGVNTGSASSGSDSKGITTDPDGNILIIGKFTVFYFSFGGQSIQNTGFVSSSDMILAKFNPAGSLLWSRLGWDGSYTNEEGVKVVCDSSGNYYCAGQFDGPSFLIDTSFANNTINGTKDIFLAKINKDGHSIWIKHFGGTGDDKVMDLTIDSNGNPILSGIFTDSIHLGNSNYISYGHEDIFILKCDQNGNIKWSKHGGGVSGEFAYGISTDEFGGVYIAGTFQGPDLFLDSITLHSAVNNSNDLFVAKYDSSGVIKWAQGNGGQNNDEAMSIKVDHGAVYVTGYFQTDSFYFGNHMLRDTGYHDIFIAKCDLDGNWLWARTISDYYDKYVTDITADDAGDIYVTGGFSGFALNFDTIAITPYSPGQISIFIAKFNSSGNAIWAKSAGGNGVASKGQDIAVDHAFRVYIAGFHDTYDLFLDNIVIQSGNGRNMFIAQIVDPLLNTNNSEINDNCLVFPNPVTDDAYIQFNKALERIEICNSFGSIIKTCLNPNTKIIRMGELSAGLYFVRMYPKGSEPFVKILIKN